MQTSRVIVLRRYRLTESSLVAELLAETHGKLRVVARGALRSGSAMAGCIDLFQLCEARVTRSRRSSLHSLADAVLIEPHAAIRGDYQRTLAAAYFCQLTAMVLPDESPSPEVFELLRKALEYLARSAPVAAAVTRFESRLLAELGLGGDDGGPPHERLAEHAGALPRSRERLLEALRDGAAAGSQSD